MSIQTALQDHLQARGLDRAVADLMGRAATVPGLARRCAAAGINPAAVDTVAALSQLPVLAKDAAIGLQQQDPPFGGMLAEAAEVVRIFQSPGPLYEPQLAGTDSWRWGQAFIDLGLGAGDTVLNCFGYHLSPAGAMLEAGVLATGAQVMPAGIGNQDLQVRAIADLGVTAYAGLPSYLKALIERYDEVGHPRERWLLDRALVTAEPLPDSLRDLLTQRVPTVRMAYGTGETGLLAYENGDGAGLVLAQGVLVQVCDIATGEPLTDETPGEVVVTVLRPDYPLVRFGTGDLSAWMLGPDGSLRLQGVLGRTGSAVKVKGMFLHPAQIGPVMAGAAGVADYRFVVDRADHVDTLRCEVVPEAGADVDALVADLRPRIRDGLRFRADVAVVEELTPGEGPILDRRDWS